MSNPIIQYMHLTYEEWKSFEAQCKAFTETTHKTEGGFYHKSLRLKFNGLIVEYHAPMVGGYGHKPKIKRKVKRRRKTLAITFDRTQRKRAIKLKARKRA